MSLTTDEIKKLANRIREAEALQKSCRSGFLKSPERFGGSARATEFEIAINFQMGSGIEGSINERMFAAQKRGLQMLEKELREEALKIIAEVL